MVRLELRQTKENNNTTQRREVMAVNQAVRKSLLEISVGNYSTSGTTSYCSIVLQ